MDPDTKAELKISFLENGNLSLTFEGATHLTRENLERAIDIALAQLGTVVSSGDARYEYLF